MNARPCPHCGNAHPGPHHLRDAGNLPADQAAANGYCPTLAAARNRQQVAA